MVNTTIATKEDISDTIRDVNDKIRDVQCLLDAIGKFNPGGHEDRLAAMAEKQLEDIVSVLDQLPTKGVKVGGPSS